MRQACKGSEQCCGSMSRFSGSGSDLLLQKTDSDSIEKIYPNANLGKTRIFLPKDLSILIRFMIKIYVINPDPDQSLLPDPYASKTTGTGSTTLLRNHEVIKPGG